MAIKLVPCPACEHQVSPSTRRCPNCGHKCKRYPKALIVVITIFVCVGIWFYDSYTTEKARRDHNFDDIYRRVHKYGSLKAAEEAGDFGNRKYPSWPWTIEELKW